MTGANSSATFNAMLHLVAKLEGRGDHADAITVMLPWAERPLAPFEYAVLAYNLGQVFLTSGQPDAAFEWLAWGVEHERAAGRTFLSEQRAVHLFEAGRRDDAVAVWRELLACGLLEEKNRTAIEHNLRVAAGQA